MWIDKNTKTKKTEMLFHFASINVSLEATQSAIILLAAGLQKLYYNMCTDQNIFIPVN